MLAVVMFGSGTKLTKYLEPAGNMNKGQQGDPKTHFPPFAKTNPPFYPFPQKETPKPPGSPHEPPVQIHQTISHPYSDACI